MLVELLNQGFEREVWLVFGVPYSTDIMYNEEFLYFAERHPNFHYVTAISREQLNARGDKLYVQDRLEEHQDTLVPLLEKPDTLFYMCGLKGMEYGIYPWLYRIGSNLVNLPEGLTVEDIQRLPRDAPEWTKIERVRDRKRLLKETY
jgi:ferredoxin--NADP+ reductase